MRPWAGFAGVALVAALWLLPLTHWAGGHFPAHMVRHMGLVALAPPLLILGFPGLSRPFARSPMLGAVVEFLVVWGWHLPWLHAQARQGLASSAIEQASFLLVGLLVWGGALRGGGPLAGAGAMLLTSMHMTLLGALILLAPRDLYAAALGRAADLEGQQLGGLIMLGIGTPVYLAAGLWLVSQALNASEAPT